MITEIGKALRMLRVEKDERLLDMSQKIGKSTAFISAVEVGRKSPPQGLEEIVIKAYQLSEKAADVLRHAADQSRKAFTLEPSSELGKDTAGLLARKMNTLNDNELEKILSILRKSSEGK